MRIVVDHRERDLLQHCTAFLEKVSADSRQKISILVENLPLGDVIIQEDDGTNLLIIERKSFSDLLASIKDGRYDEQSHRLLNASRLPPHSILYILEGVYSQVSEKDKKTIYSCIVSLQFFKGFSVFKTSSVAETGELVVAFADKIVRGFAKGRVPYLSHPIPVFPSVAGAAPSEDEKSIRNDSEGFRSNAEEYNYCAFVKKVKKDNVTPENIGEIMLSQIPGVSSVTAVAIMKKFSTIPNLIRELGTDPECLNGIMLENSGKSRKMSKSSIESIRRYLNSTAISINI